MSQRQDRSRRRERRMLLTSLRTRFSLVSSVLLACHVTAHRYIDFFHPDMEEYDFGILDPNSLHGAPLGGYARSTTSRLAKLPLPLPSLSDVSLEDFVPQYTESVIRDASGRPFVCRVYHEDELDPSTIGDSMFDIAVLQQATDGTGTAPRSTESSDTVSFDGNDRTHGTGAAPDGSQESVDREGESLRPRQLPIDPSQLSETAFFDGQQQYGVDDDSVPDKEASPPTPVEPAEQQQDQTSAPIADTPIPDQFITAVATASHRLKELEAVCAQVHKGWWSYEWCHESKISQFHIHLSSEDGTGQIEIQDVSNLGKFDRRIVEVTELLPDDMSMPNVEQRSHHAAVTVSGEKTVPTEAVRKILRNEAKYNYIADEVEYDSSLQGIAKVRDIFTSGDECPETGQPRRTEVVIQCCSDKIMKRFKSGVLVRNQPVPTAIAGIAKPIEEDEVCVYRMQICTPVLCRKDDDDAVLELESIRHARDMAEGMKSTGFSQFQPRRNVRTVNAAEMSVLEILDYTFSTSKTACMLAGTGGWWIYELCHKRHVRQFHETTVMDRISGATSIEVESEYFLGFYQETPTSTQSDDDDDVLLGNGKVPDWKVVVNTTDLPDPGRHSRLPSRKRKVTKNKVYGGNGAYYPVEFSHGDVCEDPDVTDSAIKAGEVGHGGIERASSVRYHCGPQLNMNVKEDSTCHYIVDVAIPMLCDHPLFRAPVSKKQVVKCLPVDEAEF